MSQEAWHADINITKEQIKKCLQVQFPCLLPLTEVKRVGEGWDNLVFLINKKIIFRFPRRKIAVELMEQENTILQHLQSLFTLKIPNPHYIGRPSAEFPYPFHGYEQIAGVSACHAQLSSSDRIASIESLSIFLKQLHAIKPAQAQAMGAKAQLFDKTQIAKTIDTLHYRVNKIIDLNLCKINKENFHQEILQIQSIKLPHEPCLVHGDLYCRHLIFDQGQLTGIIDWGDVGISHKTVDLAVIWGFYPTTCHQTFQKIYGAVDPVTWQYARFLGLYSGFSLWLYGNDVGDSPLVAEAQAIIQRINPQLLN